MNKTSMFTRSRVKIIASIMAALLLFLIVTIAVIYGSSYHQIQSENRELLAEFSQRFSLSDTGTGPAGGFGPGGPADNGREMVLLPPENGAEGEGPGGKMEDRNRAFSLSTFYYVAFSESGEVLAYDNRDGEMFSEEQLTSLALEVLEESGTEGVKDRMFYLITEKEDFTLVAFMDNSLVRSNMNTLLRNTLVSFGISVVLVFFLSLILSGSIIAPLEENDRRQKQFVSDAGHELKTPLAVMNTNCELLSREIGENQWLSNICYENERMSLLVKELLDLSHAESDTMPEEMLDLSDLVTGEALPFESIAFESGLTLETNIADGISILGNPTQLKQLTAILLDNAISHSDGGDLVTLDLSSDKKNAVLSVTNYGKEIPLDKQELLFERFYRLDEARTEDGGNHYGLGLAIAKAITQAHHGTIAIGCKEGKVTFTVTLPIRK